MEKKFYAGGFLYDSKSGRVLLHKRDGNTKINPNKWAFFGGLQEEGETPTQCFVRELEEEIGLKVNEDEVVPLCDYLNVELDTYRYVFFVESTVQKDNLKLGEGAGFDWVHLAEINNKDLTEKTRLDLEVLIKRLK